MLASRVQLGSVLTSFAQLTRQVAVMNQTVFALGTLLVLYSVLLSGALGTVEQGSGSLRKMRKSCSPVTGT